MSVLCLSLYLKMEDDTGREVQSAEDVRAQAGFSIKLCGPRGRSPNTQATGMYLWCILYYVKTN